MGHILWPEGIATVPLLFKYPVLIFRSFIIEHLMTIENDHPFTHTVHTIAFPCHNLAAQLSKIITLFNPISNSIITVLHSPFPGKPLLILLLRRA